MGIQQPDCLVKILVFKFVVDRAENSDQYLPGIMWIEDVLAILHLLLNTPCTLVSLDFVLHDLFQLFPGMFD